MCRLKSNCSRSSKSSKQWLLKKGMKSSPFDSSRSCDFANGIFLRKVFGLVVRITLLYLPFSLHFMLFLSQFVHEMPPKSFVSDFTCPSPLLSFTAPSTLSLHLLRLLPWLSLPFEPSLRSSVGVVFTEFSRLDCRASVACAS